MTIKYFKANTEHLEGKEINNLLSSVAQHSKTLCSLFYFKKIFIFTLQYCIGFAIHWHESSTSVLLTERENSCPDPVWPQEHDLFT